MKKKLDFLGMRLIEAGYLPPVAYTVKIEGAKVMQDYCTFDLKMVDEVTATGKAQMDAYRYIIESMNPQSVGHALRKPVAMANPYAALPVYNCTKCLDTGKVFDFSGMGVDYKECPHCVGAATDDSTQQIADEHVVRTKCMDGEWVVDESKDDIMSITRGMFK